MHYAYVLQSEKNKDIYIGNTYDLQRRISEHNNGENYSTSNNRPYRLVYYEAYLDKADAIGRERELKHHGSVIGHLKKSIKRSFNV